MIQMTVAFYDERGVIVSMASGIKENVFLSCEASNYPYVVVDDVENVSCDTHYVKSGVIVEKPPQPDPYSTFSYKKGEWIFDIAAAREAKWAEIKSHRDNLEVSGFTWGAYEFDSDRVSQQRISSAVQLAALDPDMTIEWTLADNSTQMFTSAQMIQIGQALAQHVTQIHERGRILRAEIYAASTLTTVERIEWQPTI